MARNNRLLYNIDIRDTRDMDELKAAPDERLIFKLSYYSRSLKHTVVTDDGAYPNAMADGQ